jgi:hypothetical protein
MAMTGMVLGAGESETADENSVKLVSRRRENAFR